MNELLDQIQAGNVSQQLPYHTHNGVDSPIINVSESSLLLADTTTGDATTSRHGLLPKLSGTATEFLDGTGDFDTVKDSDLSTSDITTNDASTSKHGFLRKLDNDTTHFLRGDGSWSLPTVTNVVISVTAGETLVAGDVVKLYKAVGNYSSDGYQMVNGTVYAVRAAANDTTYGDEVLGVATASASYLGSATIAVVGYISGLTGLTAGSKYYLSDYNTTSGVTISQTTTDSNYQLYDPTGAVVLQQLFTPTQSRMDSITIKASKNGGFSGTLRFNLYRSNTNLASADVVLTGGSTPAETTIDFADIRCYKGETLRFTLNHDSGVSSQTDAFYIAYQSTGSVYNGAFTGGSLPASGADIYFKVKEFSDFGKVGTSAGTRKFKLGQALSTTELALLIQEADSIL